MKIMEFKQLSFQDSGKVFFIRIDPEDLTQTLNDVLKSLMNLSWISKFDEEYEKSAFESRAKKTIEDIKYKFSKCSDDNITKDAGEYVVSELSRKAIVNQLKYLDIPIGELLGKKNLVTLDLIFIVKILQQILSFSEKLNTNQDLQLTQVQFLK